VYTVYFTFLLYPRHKCRRYARSQVDSRLQSVDRFSCKTCKKNMRLRRKQIGSSVSREAVPASDTAGECLLRFRWKQLLTKRFKLPLYRSTRSHVLQDRNPDTDPRNNFVSHIRHTGFASKASPQRFLLWGGTQRQRKNHQVSS
jgi:hypothetical protein